MTLSWRPPQLPVRHPIAVLTPRQADVLTGICYGLSNAAIGRRLGLSEDTVKSHSKSLYKKLGARDRCHAVALTASRQVTVHVKEQW